MSKHESLFGRDMTAGIVVSSPLRQHQWAAQWPGRVEIEWLSSCPAPSSLTPAWLKIGGLSFSAYIPDTFGHMHKMGYKGGPVEICYDGPWGLNGRQSLTLYMGHLRIMFWVLVEGKTLALLKELLMLEKCL